MTRTIFSRETRMLPATDAALGARRKMLASVAAGVTALSLLLASAVPSRAEIRGDDLARAVIAAVAIGAIANAIEKNRKPSQMAPALPEPMRTHGVRAPRIPSSCAIEIAGKRRDLTVYPERCLRREGVSGRLPNYCAMTARIYGRQDRVYPEDCLREAGFRVSGDGHPRGRGHGYGHYDDHHHSHRGYDQNGNGWAYKH